MIILVLIAIVLLICFLERNAHKCEFDYDNFDYDKMGWRYHKCKHKGCRGITFLDKNKNLY